MKSNQNILDSVNVQFLEDDLKNQAHQNGVGYINLQGVPLNVDHLKILTKEEAEANKCICFYKNGKTIRVALSQPNLPSVSELIKTLQKTYEVEIFWCSQKSFEEKMELYNSVLVTRKKVETTHSFSEKRLTVQEVQTEFNTITTLFETSPAVEILQKIFSVALSSGASDIHFQPTESGLNIRLRIDGALKSFATIPLKKSPQIIAQIKYDGGMKSNILDIPQDGKIEFKANGRIIDLRVSTLPIQPIESVVMRILDTHKGIKSFSELGFDKLEEDKIKQALYRKNGIILVTGATGSGKTTTLYSMLKELNSPERKLVTLEDPIEYHLPGVSQSQVDDTREYNFESGFKSLLRHDPDVILVGEVRTVSTAKLAFEAALTGHTVLTSLHTNNAIGAISRLRNMGLQNYQIAPTINAVFAQKLVRTFHPTAKKVLKNTNELRNQFPALDKALTRIKQVFLSAKIPEKIIDSVETPEQDYRGQTVICEAFLLDDPVRKMILEEQSEFTINEYLINNTNFLSLFENGVLKVLEGKTSLQEVIRTVGI
ncbi:hypothetical protein CSB37_01880 [bacterium DOLZORAL124_38_8]|nr:MAG: hypothetical protein CSB37_01880 [bacterium DOLZORAL124_38_8]